MMRPRDCRRGYVLLEMLAYAGILGLIANLVMSIMINGGRLNAIGAAALDRVKNAGDIREVFVRDVRASVGAADGALSYTSGPGLLVLEMPAAEDARRCVVYGPLRTTDRLNRLEFTLRKDGTSEIESFQTFPLDLEGFRVERPSPGLVAMELDADVVGNRPVPPGVRRKPPVTYRFVAASRSKQEGAA